MKYRRPWVKLCQADKIATNLYFLVCEHVTWMHQLSDDNKPSIVQCKDSFHTRAFNLMISSSVRASFWNHNLLALRSDVKTRWWKRKACTIYLFLYIFLFLYGFLIYLFFIFNVVFIFVLWFLLCFFFQFSFVCKNANSPQLWD